ncbi:MAG TPA: N-acetylmuramoyl-L-alanine amidase [Bacillales bacterium]|nr:N-acetylmuramoyl-L-alanine amidase [Bacillales bacterium]
MHKQIRIWIILCALFGFLWTGSGVQAEGIKEAEVGVKVLNVRAGPSLEDEVIGQIKGGNTFKVLNERFGWLEIQLGNGETGWVAGQFTIKSTGETSPETSPPAQVNKADGSTVTLLYDGTNLRNGPGLRYNVIARGSEGDRFSVLGKSGNWYHIELSNGTKAFVAGWIVVPSTQKKAALQGKTIVVDPGHGGFDSGAIGNFYDTLEKKLTLRTANQLTEKLREAGAYVVMTRNDDTFISLEDRVNIAEKYEADAFISIHYNASLYPSASGVTSYYYTKSKDRPLAKAIQEVLVQQTDRDSRGVRFANYHVLRENAQPATLLELGFLTNSWEEHVVSTSGYQDTVTSAIVDGVENYFEELE